MPYDRPKTTMQPFTMCPDCLAEYRRNNTVYVGAYSTTPYRVMCRQPVRSMDDLRGLRMRASLSRLSSITAVPMGCIANIGWR